MKKRRTRSHVIADLSANHVERYALLCGYTVERFVHDYGVDLALYTYDANGEIENSLVFLQLKATESLIVLEDGQTISFSIKRADLELWLRETMPYILILYDAQSDIAYWVYIQAYFERLPGFNLAQIGETTTIRLKMSDVVNEDAIRTFARFKVSVLRQMQGVVHYG